MSGMEILLVVGCIVVVAVLFMAWLVVHVVMAIVRGIASVVRKPAPPAQSPAPIGLTNCRHTGCREINPSHARFCRRCGKSTATGTASSVRMRYVA